MVTATWDEVGLALIPTGLIKPGPPWDSRAAADGSFFFLFFCQLFLVEGDTGRGSRAPEMFSCVGPRLSLPSHKPSASCQAGGGEMGGREKMLFSWLVFIDM